MIRSWIIKQNAAVLSGKFFEASNSRRTSTGADFKFSFCFEQSKTIRGTRFLKSERPIGYSSYLNSCYHKDNIVNWEIA